MNLFPVLFHDYNCRMKWRRSYFYIALGAVLLIGSSLALFAGNHFRWYKAPYDHAGKAVAWIIGMPEPAYNFDTVVAGRLYRSGLPDARFLDYARERYGIRHLVSLSGASEVHVRAKELGMNVTVLNWRTDKLPVDDLKLLLALFDGTDRVLVHCHAGRDRSGYAIALYRISRQQWTVERAIRDMEAHGHSRRARLETDRVLRQALAELAEQHVGLRPRELDPQTPPHFATLLALAIVNGTFMRSCPDMGSACFP